MNRVVSKLAVACALFLAGGNAWADEKPAKVRKDLERRGVIEAVRSDIARSKALAFLMDHAEVVDADGEPVDLSLPQPEASEGTEPEEPEGTSGDGTVTEASTTEDEQDEEESEEPAS